MRTGWRRLQWVRERGQRDEHAKTRHTRAYARFPTVSLSRSYASKRSAGSSDPVSRSKKTAADSIRILGTGRADGQPMERGAFVVQK